MRVITKYLQYIVAVVFTGSIIAAPLFVNHDFLPGGWELPKVHFLQIISLGLILLAILVLILIKSLRPKLSDINPWLIALFIVVIWSTLFCEFTRKASLPGLESPLYKFILDLVGISSSNSQLNMAIWGNMFRDFGAITLYLVLLAIVLSIRAIPPKWKEIVPVALIFSSLVQSIISIFQFLNDPWTTTRVYGTFGQPNFLAGHLLSGLVFSLYFTLHKTKLVSILGYITSATLILGIFLTSSFWAYFITILLMTIYILFRSLKTSNFKRIFISILSLTGIFQLLAFVGIGRSITIPEIEARTRTWNETLRAYVVGYFRDPLNINKLRRLLLGTGQDTLGEHMQSLRHLSNIYLDRAHNIFLDVLASLGILGVICFGGIVISSLKKSIKNLNDKYTVFMGIAVFILLARCLVHTSSIINYMDLIIVIAAASSAKWATP